MSNQTEIRHDIGAQGTLELRTVSGSIRLAGTDGSEAVVTVHGDENALRELAIERGPGRLLVQPQRVDFGFLRRGHVDFDFDVTLPRNARVDVKAVSADITARNLGGEQEYKTVSGELRLSNVAGRVTIQTVSGDVRLEDGGRLELSTTATSGDVHVEAELIDYLRVKTVSGDLRLEGRLADGPRHTVETVSGDLNFRTTGGVTVEPQRALDIGRSGRRPVIIGDGAAQLTFRSMSGDEHVTAVGTATSTRETPRSATAPAPAMTAAAADSDVPTSTYRTAAAPTSRLDVLRALERGEIDVEEAARRLEEVSVDA
jgi:Putative adhesin